MLEQLTLEILERYWPKIDLSDLDGCWPWMAGRLHWGHGAFTINAKMERAHRVMWVLHYGEIPQGLCVCHQCDNPPCCNPNHLFLGTHRENMADRNAKGRTASGDRSGSALHPEVHQGERHWKTRLKEVDIREIRALRGQIRQIDLASRFGVDQGQISAIQLGKAWKHIK